MDYHFRHQITHKNGKLIEDKVNYFADYFDFYYKNWGHHFLPELENHKSLLEKILIQLNNYNEHSKNYLPNYFSNNLLNYKDFIISNFYSKNWKEFNAIKNNQTNLSDSTTRLKATIEIQKLIALLNETLLQNLIDSIVKIFTCEHPLEKHLHKKQLDYLTTILVAEFFYAGFEKDDLKQIFSRILTKEIKFENANPVTDFPLPEHLHNLKIDDKEKYFSEVSLFLKNRNLKQQFEGIYNFYKNEQGEKTFIFQIDNLGCNFKNEIDWNYNDVIISNTLSEKYVKENTAKEFANFFENKETVLAETSVIGINNNSSRNNAIRKVNDAINYLNANRNLSTSINPFYYVIKDKNSSTFHRSYRGSIHSEDKNQFDENNIYKILEGFDDTYSVRIKNIDTFYVMGISSIYVDVRLKSIWQYFECFFHTALQLENELSTILANHFYSSEIVFFDFLIHIIIDNVNNPKIFEKFKDNKKVFDWFQADTLVEKNLKDISEEINHPYLTPLINKYLKKSNEEKIDFSKKYITKILKESYEQRNIIEHDGKFNEKAVNKLLLSLEKYINVFRWQLIKCIKEKKFNSFEESKKHLLKTNQYSN
jgi:hypothetical protein